MQPIPQDEKQFLASYRQEQYDRPSLAADLAVFSISFSHSLSYRQDTQTQLEVLLVRRAEMPCQGCWSLPGGFVRRGETIESCACRVLQSKTGVTPKLLVPSGVYSAPGRDPRGWIVSRAFMSILPHISQPAPGAAWFAVEAEQTAPQERRLILHGKNETMTARMCAKPNGFGQIIWECAGENALAFDHAQILMTALDDLQQGVMDFRYLFDFLPEEFTLSTLQGVQETIAGKKTGAANFRRKAAEHVQETEKLFLGAGHRPAKMYRQKREAEASV